MDLSKKLIATLIGEIIQELTPALRERLRDVVLELEADAQATDNPFDDLAVAALKTLLSTEE